MQRTMSAKRKKRLIRSFVSFTIAGSLIGFSLGVFVGKASCRVEAVSEPIVIIEQPVSEEPEIIVPDTNIVSLGTCRITAYCCENYPHICNNGDSSTTATGTRPTPGRTIAVDPNVIPYDSEVTVFGHTYIAEDCGGGVKGNSVDILFATHEEALSFGVRYAEVSYVERSESDV